MSAIGRKTFIVAAVLILYLLIIASLWVWFINDSPQADGGLWCDKENLDSIGNNSGWIISWHNTVCSGFGGSSAIYIYVHKIGQRESEESLVFRYFEHGGSDLPKIEWINKDEVSIKVDRVSQVTRKISSVGSVKILYSIGKEDYFN